MKIIANIEYSNGWFTLPHDVADRFSDGIIYVTIHVEPGLLLMTKEEFDVIADKIKALPQDMQKRVRPILSNAAKCEISKKGSIFIPMHLREYMRMEGLQKTVLIEKDEKLILCVSDRQ